MIKLSAPAFSLDAQSAVLDYLGRAATCLDPSAERRNFEAELAAYLGVPEDWVLCTNSCTAALHLFYLTNDRAMISCPVLTWPGSFIYADYVKMIDVGEDGFPEKRSDMPREVLVDLWGRGLPARLSYNRAQEGVAILDAAHHFGSGIEGLDKGWWDAVAYSFGPVKELTVGRGGALVGALCARPEVREMANVGTSLRRPSHQCGGNFEMPELAAAMGPAQLALYQRSKSLRRQLLVRYWERLPAEVVCLTTPAASGHLMVIGAADNPTRNRIRGKLSAAGCQSSIHYLLPEWVKEEDYPNAAALSSTVLSLPCHTGLTPEDVDKVCAVVAKAVSRPQVPAAKLPSRRTSARPRSTARASGKQGPSSIRRASRSTGRPATSAARRRSRGS